jgi:hypothetical protein
VIIRSVSNVKGVTLTIIINSLNAELNPIRHLLALAGAHHFVDVSRIRVNALECTNMNVSHGNYRYVSVTHVDHLQGGDKRKYY